VKFQVPGFDSSCFERHKFLEDCFHASDAASEPLFSNCRTSVLSYVAGSGHQWEALYL